MAPTPHLERCEYLRQVLASFKTVLGRTRLMRLDGEAEATLHVDTNYYWFERVRVHVPITTSPAIEFICDERSLHMPEGEAWIFDAWRPHNVLNPTGDRRIHLVADTVGSDEFWRLVAQGERPFLDDAPLPADTEHVPYREGASVALETERTNFPVVMGPWEQATHANRVLDELDPGANGSEDPELLRERVQAFLRDWRATWARHGAADSGWPEYSRLLEDLNRSVTPLEGKLKLANGTDAVEIVRQMLIRPGLNPNLAANGASGGRSRQPQPPAVPARRRRQPQPRARIRPGALAARFDRPIFIVAPPRSGTSLLFETLARSPTVWTVGGESHAVMEGMPALHPANRGWDSNRATATDVGPGLAERLRAAFLAQLRDREGSRPDPQATGLRMLEKTPKNSLRIPFLKAVFPHALFIYMYRDPRQSLASMIEAWNSGRFVTYPNLPGWEGPPWSLLLTPEWRRLSGKELPEIVAAQWKMATQILLDDLERLPPQQVAVVTYDALVEEPQREVARLCRFAGIGWDQELTTPLPLSRHTVTPPDPEKWKQQEAELEAVLPDTAEVAERARKWVETPPTSRPRRPDPRTSEGSPFRSVVSGDLSQILDQMGISLMVTTYQTGRLVCVRRLGEGINTHFRFFETPMGLALRNGRFAIGTKSQVWEYHNLPQLCGKLEPKGQHDACFVPRRTHYTGDIRIHEIAYVGDELWIVATKFSCLATLDDHHSFVPRWRPPFITKLAADDRCHLNGLAVIDDRIRFVTALGQTDQPGGWRENKAHGGILIDVDSGETAISGLSMPHSPRWYRDRLWLLESGEGTLATVDLDSGRVETVVELPGFTRGLAFAGPIAFVGLSEVREATTFGGIPLTGRLEERQCGVWMVNIESGEVIGFLRFEDLVQEVFDVAVIPGLQFPEVAEHGSEAVNLSYVVPNLEQAAATR
jgi:uncharacterized protein (TIGR03032 family)